MVQESVVVLNLVSLVEIVGEVSFEALVLVLVIFVRRSKMLVSARSVVFVMYRVVGVARRLNIGHTVIDLLSPRQLLVFVFDVVSAVQLSLAVLESGVVLRIVPLLWVVLFPQLEVSRLWVLLGVRGVEVLVIRELAPIDFFVISDRLSHGVSALDRPLELLVAQWMAMLLVVVLGATNVSLIMKRMVRFLIVGLHAWLLALLRLGGLRVARTHKAVGLALEAVACVRLSDRVVSVSAGGPLSVRFILHLLPLVIVILFLVLEPVAWGQTVLEVLVEVA